MKPSPYTTPDLERIRREANIARATVKVYEIHEKFLEEIDNVKALLAANFREMNRIKSLPEGKKGKDGRDGYSYSKKEIEAMIRPLIPAPEKGRDGKDADPVDINKVIASVLKSIPKPKDGKDAEVDMEALAETVVQKIFSEKKLRKEHIFGLDAELASTRSLAGKQYGKDTWARGGGMTMSAGSNITLVPQADGTVRINASGGGSGTNVATQYSLTAVQSGSDVTIDLTQLTNWATFDSLIAVYRNNIMQTETLNFTFASPTVTILNADASEVFNCTYAYA